MIDHAQTAPVPGEATVGSRTRLGLGALSWSLFEGARNPYIVLIVIYVFMPYISAAVVGDPVKGQQLVSQFAQYAGWIVMLTAPFLGAAVDALGKRKLWLGLLVALMCPLMALLWFVRSDGSGIPLTVAMLMIMGLNVLFPYTEVLHNSLLVKAAGLRGAHKASGLALALGNFISVLALLFTMCAFVLPAKAHFPIPAPLFGLDPDSHEPERIVGPMVALIFALGVLPLFLFTPDAERTGISPVRAFADGARTLVRMVKTVGHHRDAAIFLASRMFYVDGMTAILFYYGIYAAGVMHWGPLELLVNGILLSILAVLGGFVGGWMDAGFGPKRAVQVSLAVSLVGVVGLLGMAPGQILYAWSYDIAAQPPLWAGPVFKTMPDVVFIAIGCVTSIFITAQYASSRTLLTRLAPPTQTGTFFGLYALSGTATVWLGSLMVNLGTSLFHSQQGGLATTTLLLGLGFVGLMFVKAPAET